MGTIFSMALSPSDAGDLVEADLDDKDPAVLAEAHRHQRIA